MCAASLHDSLRGAWWILEFLPKSAKYKEWPARQTYFGFYIPDAEPRLIPEGAFIHESVVKRMDALADYRPVNLPARFRRCRCPCRRSMGGTRGCDGAASRDWAGLHRCAPSPACGGGLGWGCLRGKTRRVERLPPPLSPPQAGEVRQQPPVRDARAWRAGWRMEPCSEVGACTAALPLPLAGEGWGGGASAERLVEWRDFPHPPRSTSASTSPASGRGAPTTTSARCLTGKSPISCPARPQKIFRFRRRANQRYQLAPSRLTGGAYAQSSRNARRDAMDAAARETSAPMRTAKSCGPDAPTLASSS